VAHRRTLLLFRVPHFHNYVILTLIFCSGSRLILLARDSARAFEKTISTKIWFELHEMVNDPPFLITSTKSFVCLFYYGTLSCSHSRASTVAGSRKHETPSRRKKTTSFNLVFIVRCFSPGSLVIRQISSRNASVVECVFWLAVINEFKLHMTKLLQLFDSPNDLLRINYSHKNLMGKVYLN
jgi:hypothetical protein